MDEQKDGQTHRHTDELTNKQVDHWPEKKEDSQRYTDTDAQKGKADK